MKMKRVLCAILAGLMLTGSLAACATSEENPAETKRQTGLSDETETQSIISSALPDDLDYDGDEITIISRYKAGWTDCEIGVEGLKGEPVNDAVFERNKAVEERLNVQIVSIEDNTDSHGAVVGKVATAVRGGNDDYDMMAAPCYTTLPETLNGTFVDLRGDACEYLDPDQVWWTQGFHEAVEYNGSQFAILGSMVLSMYRFGFVTVFNKAIFDNASQTYPYEYVKNGTWTLDKQASIVPLFYRDNGDGVQDATGDIYGLVTSSYTNIDAYWSACKLDIIKKDEDGMLQVVQDVDRLHGTVDKLIRLYYETNNSTYDVSGTADDTIWSTIRQMFADGEAAMASFRFMEMENSVMRNMEQEYGVVPMPKYDETQDDHYTLLHDQFTVVAVPTTVTGDRITQMSAVLEAMASASYSIVKPVYYEETLRTKIAQDPTASEMMDIITDNVYIDAGILYISYLGSYHHAMRNIVKSRSNTAVSAYTAKNRACKKAVESLTKQLNKVIAKQQK